MGGRGQKPNRVPSSHHFFMRSSLDWIRDAYQRSDGL